MVTPLRGERARARNGEVHNVAGDTGASIFTGDFMGVRGVEMSKDIGAQRSCCEC